MINAHRILRRLSIVLTALIACLLAFQGARASSIQGISDSLAATGTRNEDAMLKYLVPVLNHDAKAARIYYAASCQTDEDYPYYPYPFPKINVQPPSRDVFGVSAVRQIFQGDANIKVEETPDGIIRVRIGELHDEILRTKIPRITLTPKQQYNDWASFFAIQDSNEVQAAMHKLSGHFDSEPGSWHVTEPDKASPHLPESLTKVTMDQALDLVAKTFKEIVLYGTCTRQRYYIIYSTGGPNFDMSSLPP
jgi:hypothetical protein